MKKELKLLADEMRVLKLKDKAIFLREIKNCAILYDRENPQNIPGCSVDERESFRNILMKNLFYKLRGHYYAFPKYGGRFLSEEKRKEFFQDTNCENRISNGLRIYCLGASEKERKQFERRVKMPRLLAPFLRKKSVLDYNFR